MPNLATSDNSAAWGNGNWGTFKWGQILASGSLYGWGNGKWGDFTWGAKTAVFGGYRYRLGDEILAYFMHRYSTLAEFETYFLHRYNQEDVINYFTHKYGIYIERDIYFHHRYNIDPTQVLVSAIIGGGMEGFDASDYVSPVEFGWKTGFGTFDAGLSIVGAGPGGDFCAPSLVSINLPDSDASTFSLHIDAAKDYHPDKSGSWQNVLNANPYSSGNLSKFFVAKPTLGGGGGLEYIGCGTNFSDSQASGGWLEIDWGGIDVPHLKLSVESQTMATVESTAAQAYTMHQVTKEIADEYGVPIDTSSATNYVVPIFNRQNSRPIDWLTELWDALLCKYKVRGNGLVVFDPGTTSRVWQYNSAICGRGRTSTTSLQKVINKVRVVRTSRAATTATANEANRQEVYTFGQYTYTFDAVLYSVRPQIIAAGGGVFSNFEYYDEGDHLIAVRTIRENSAASPGEGVVQPISYPSSVLGNGNVNGAKYCKYTWGARTVTQTMAGVEGAPGAIRFKGTPAMNPDNTSGLLDLPYDTEFVVTRQNADSIAVHGERFLEFEADALFPDAATAQIFADRFLKYQGTMQRQFSFEVPPNFQMEVGDRVDWSDLYLSSTHTLWVTNVQHVLSDDFSVRATNFDAVEYLYQGAITNG